MDNESITPICNYFAPLAPHKAGRVRELWLAGNSVLTIAEILDCSPYQIDTHEKAR